MSKKIIVTGRKAHKKLLEGARLIYDCVSPTYGVNGRNVAFARAWNFPAVLRDGVTVAREVEASDDLTNMGVGLVREAANATVQDVGDGTTATTILTYELVKEALKKIRQGTNPMKVRSEIQDAVKRVQKEISALSKKTDKLEDIIDVATISSGDREIGKMVATAVHKVGRDGLVTVEEGKSIDTEVEYTQGMEFNKGFKAPHFITDPTKMEAVVRNPLVVISKRKISVNDEIVPLLNELVKGGEKNVVFIADMSGNALATLVANKMQGNIQALAVDLPYHGDQQENFLDDIALVTGGLVIPEEFDLTNPEVLKTVIEEHLGRAKYIGASKTTTVIVEGKGDKKAVEKRIKSLRTRIEKEGNPFEVEKLQERLAKLTTGVGVIKVGAKTEVEMRERIELVKDAVGSARAVYKGGIVEGAGMTFYRASQALTGSTIGERIVKHALKKPALKILENAGEGFFKKHLLLHEALGNGTGYNMKTGQLVDLITEGIIDPAHGIKLSLENAVSVATSILTTEVLIAIKTQEPKLDD